MTDATRQGFQKHAGVEQRPPRFSLRSGEQRGVRGATPSSHPRPLPVTPPITSTTLLSETKVLTMTRARPLPSHHLPALCSRPPVGSAMFLDGGRGGEVQNGDEPGPLPTQSLHVRQEPLFLAYLYLISSLKLISNTSVTGTYICLTSVR